ncbi:uncharacterized protein [Epargyreus clarus]|uniref:uncharacterized protein isoform X1 n=1 Tax=Epargyreus clarus TaxID=520877 RepID=UPI003C2F5BBE
MILKGLIILLTFRTFIDVSAQSWNSRDKRSPQYSNWLPPPPHNGWRSPRDHDSKPPPSDYYDRPPPPPPDHYGRPPPYDGYNRHPPPHHHYGRPPPHDHYGRPPPYGDYHRPPPHDDYDRPPPPPPHWHYGRPPPPPPPHDQYNEHSSPHHHYGRPPPDYGHYGRPPPPPPDWMNDWRPPPPKYNDRPSHNKNFSPNAYQQQNPSSQNGEGSKTSLFQTNKEEDLIRLIEFIFNNQSIPTSTPSVNTGSFRKNSDQTPYSPIPQIPKDTQDVNKIEYQVYKDTETIPSTENPYIFDLRDGFGLEGTSPKNANANREIANDPSIQSWPPINKPLLIPLFQAVPVTPKSN